MAIADNTDYTLKGSQVKDLANKINGKAETSSLSAVATSGNYNDLSNKPSLATVATSGSYNDLTNKPTIPAAQVNSDWNAVSGIAQILNKPSLATVATSGSYNDLSNKPTIPAAQIQSNWTQSDNTKKDYIKNKPSLATVATTGSYNDLTDKPTIPVDEVIYIPITITSVQDMTFSTTETAAEVIAMMDAGKKVMYRMTIPSQVGPIAPGVYDFTAQYYSNSTVIGVMTGYITGVTVGLLGHVNNAGEILMFNLQEKIDANNKLSADYIDSSNSTNKTYVTGSGAPTTSTAGTVGQIYVDTATGKVYVCTSASGGTYAWAEVSGVQSDWNQTSSSAPDYIKNKPTIPTVNNATLTVTQNGTSKGTFTANASSNKTIALTDTTYTNFTGADASTAGAAGLVPAPAAGDNTKYLSGDGTWKTVSQYALPIATANDLGGIKVGSKLSINSSTGVLSADSQTDNNFTNALKTKLDGIASGAEVNVQADWNEASSSSDAYIKNKPTIPAAQVNSDWNANSGVAQILNKPSLATVATSGSYNDLTNKPTIPAAQIQSDWTQTTTTAKDYIKNKPSLATVATSGSYTDLSNKPSIPAAQVNSDWNANSGVSQILNKPSLATVATSGSYSDLSNKPTIPTVNNSTITITNNGSTVDSFTTNASTGKTIALSAPVITMQTTDPGEGVALAANNFIAVY